MKKILFLLPMILLSSCFKNLDDAGPANRRVDLSGTGDWLISTDLVFDGGPGKDGIPALENPEMLRAGSEGLNFLNDDDLVLVYRNGLDIKAYSHNVLDWHEIANDQIGDDFVAVTYCPLTGTGIGWGRELNGEITTFGVSGLLYETNLMPYDRLTDSYWNQMFNQCVNGELIGTTPQFFNLVQMNYGTLKSFFPSAMVTSSNTGYSRDYTRYPYGDYLTNTATLFPISNSDSRLHPKEIVRGVVINGKAKAYRFSNSSDRELIRDSFEGEDLIIISDPDNDFIVSFIIDTDNSNMEDFTLVGTGTSTVLEDINGNRYDIFGYATEGPDVGTQLEIPYSYMGFWFAWADFYPDIELYE